MSTRLRVGLARLIAAQVSLHACMTGFRMAAPLMALREGHSAAAVGMLLALFALAQVFLAKEPGARIVHDPRVILATQAAVARLKARGEQPNDTEIWLGIGHANLNFEDASLAEVAAVLSRYQRLPMKVLGPSQRRLSAVVQLGDIESFVETLPVLANATLQRRDDAIWLVPR